MQATATPAREMRTLTEAFDWSATPVGPREAWSPADAALAAVALS